MDNPRMQLLEIYHASITFNSMQAITVGLRDVSHTDNPFQAEASPEFSPEYDDATR